MTRPKSEDKCRQAYAAFTQPLVLEQAKRIVTFANQCSGIHQLPTADVTETGAALMFDIPGRDFRTKKSDLSDGTQCKGATSIHTMTPYSQWSFYFPDHGDIVKYYKAPRIVLTEYYQVNGRMVVDTYVFSGKDKVFRAAVQAWEDSKRRSDRFTITTPRGRDYAGCALGKIRLPLVCRVEENAQGQMEITHWAVDECKAVTDLIQASDVNAPSAEQKEKFLCKRVK